LDFSASGIIVNPFRVSAEKVPSQTHEESISDAIPTVLGLVFSGFITFISAKMLKFFNTFPNSKVLRKSAFELQEFFK